MKKQLLLLALLWPAFLFAQDFSFVEDEFFSEESSSTLEIGGSIELPFMLNTQGENPGDWVWDSSPQLTTRLNYQGRKVDLFGQSSATVVNNIPHFTLDEAWTRLYMGRADLEAGYMKFTWGKGDQVHVMDVLNPMDYSRFIEEDYNDRKISDLMMRLNVQTGENGKLEIIFMPWYTPDTQASEGIWMQSRLTALQGSTEDVLTSYSEAYLSQLISTLTQQYIAGGMDAVTAAETAQTQAILLTAQRMGEAESDALRYEDTRTLKHAQGGIRFTDSIGPLDWGITLVRSYMDEPVVTMVDMDPAAYSTAAVLAADPYIDIGYTPMYMGALESGWVMAGFNFRQEAAFFLTEDWKGDDPGVRNSRADWLFGFDRNLPFSNIQMNLQGTGSYLLFVDGLDPTDPDYCENDRFYSHRIIVSLSDRYFYDKMEISVAGSMNIEDRDYMIQPELSYTFGDLLNLSVNYRWYQGDNDTLFGQFDDNDRLSLSFSAEF